MASPSQPPPYAYVFEQYPKSPWPRLEDLEPLSQLHTKYWGNPIQGNEPELQLPSESQAISDEGQAMDDDLDESQAMDDDSGEGQREIGTGCFVLDLGNESLKTQALWVRRDYLRFYEYCNLYCNSVLDSQLGHRSKTAPSVVITGQPGIGRCFWSLRPSILKYLLIEQGRATGSIMPSAGA
jgi:hypothetical protein